MERLPGPLLVMRLAAQLLKGTPFRVLELFQRQQQESGQRVVVYDSAKQAVDMEAKVPWPVALLLTMRGPKFVFGGVSLPSSMKMRKAMADLRRRVRTANMLGEGRGNYNPMLYAPNTQWQPAPCSPKAEAALSCFEAELARRLDDKQEEFVGSKQRGNFTPVDCLGFQLMKKLGWSAVKSDKDSSFVLLRVADRQTELRRLLEDEVHFELAASTPHALLRLSEEVRRNFKTAVGGVLACPEWARLAGGRERLERFLLQRDKPGFTCTSKLEFNLKTHKRPIVPRELEGSQKNFLQPAQKFASHVLRRELGPLAPWVVQDSAEFVRRAEAGEFVVPPNYALYSGDIKEFFPSCEHDGLAAAQERLLLARGYSIRAATAFKNLAVLLLNSQYAYAPEVEGFFRRKRGAAMGAAQASEACDTYVALNHDQVFVGPDRPAGIAWFLRFRDDCLFCANIEGMSDEKVAELKQKFSERGSQLRLEVSAHEQGEAVWLDLAISVLPTGRLAFRTHIKPTNLGQYIAADSYHSRATLDNWPVAELRRYAKNSSRWQDAEVPVRRLHECLAKRLYSVSLREMLGRTWRLWQQRAELLQPTPGTLGHKRTALVLPFHRCWRKLGVQELLKRLEGELSEAGVRVRPLMICILQPFSAPLRQGAKSAQRCEIGGRRYIGGRR